MSTAYLLRCCKHKEDSKEFNKNEDGVRWAWKYRFEILIAVNLSNSDPSYMNLIETNSDEFIQFLDNHKYCNPVTLMDEYGKEIEKLT